MYIMEYIYTYMEYIIEYLEYLLILWECQMEIISTKFMIVSAFGPLKYREIGSCRDTKNNSVFKSEFGSSLG